MICQICNDTGSTRGVGGMNERFDQKCYACKGGSMMSKRELEEEMRREYAIDQLEQMALNNELTPEPQIRQPIGIEDIF